MVYGNREVKQSEPDAPASTHIRHHTTDTMKHEKNTEKKM